MARPSTHSIAELFDEINFPYDVEGTIFLKDGSSSTHQVRRYQLLNHFVLEHIAPVHESAANPVNVLSLDRIEFTYLGNLVARYKRDGFTRIQTGKMAKRA